MAGRWLRPSDVCPACVEQEAQDDLDALYQRRVRLAAIPERYRGYSWGTAVSQAPGESEADLRQRLRRMGGRLLGVTAGNWDAIHTLDGWMPEHGSVYIEGQVGSGKTLLLCTAACYLLAEPVEFHREWDPVTGRCLGARVRGGWGVTFTSEDELAAQIRRRGSRRTGASNTEPHPVDAAKRCSVLILDDLGRSGVDWVHDVVEELVDYRYRERLPILASSNYPVSALARRISERVASRLTEMTEGRRLLLEGEWRGYGRGYTA